jgi:hypothetical protein
MQGEIRVKKKYALSSTQTLSIAQYPVVYDLHEFFFNIRRWGDHPDNQDYFLSIRNLFFFVKKFNTTEDGRYFFLHAF